jgi:PAS domain S-box-containing protein
VSENERSGSRRTPNIVSVLLLLAMGAAAMATFFVTRGVVRDQEERLLAERADEVAALLSSSFTSLESSLRVLGEVAKESDAESARVFANGARFLIRGNTATVGVVARRGADLMVLHAVGRGPRAGESLSRERVAIADRALTDGQLTPGLITNAGETRLLLALPASAGGKVTYLESVLQPSVPVPSTADSPFRELRVALYASNKPHPSRLVVTTEAELPLAGAVERVPFEVGGERWSLVVGARGPLAGSFAADVPWLLMGGGLVMALLAAGIVEVQARRRRYALTLVAQQTQELERALGELRETQGFLDRLLTAGPMMVSRTVLDDGHMSYVSPNVERLCGLSETDVLAPDFRARSIHADDLPVYAAAKARLTDGVSVQETVEYRLRHGDGTYRWVSTVLVPEVDLAGEPVAVLAYALDVDDRRRADVARQEAQEAAEAANRSKSEFLSRMSHELRTPLNAVLGFGQLLESEALTPDQHDSVRHIVKGGRHLLDLINEVLDISRVEAGELALSPEPVLAADLIQDAVDLIRPLADERGIQLVIDRSGVCDCYVFADRQRAKQILLNLLSNAVKYNRPRGTIAVSCNAAGDTRLSIDVADTGRGIPTERMGLLFTPFERLGAEDTDVEGTGIGLALSRRLAEAMSGQLLATSTLGQGSVFTVELPVVEGPLERYERLHDDDEPAPPPTDHRRRVLHIEDNLANLRLIERLLARHSNVEVVAAMHGSLGLELAREHQPAIILLDLHLPDMGGDRVLQRLRDDPLTASIPVVIVSADATTGQIQRLLAAGATAYLTKPIDVPQLLAILDKALAREPR